MMRRFVLLLVFLPAALICAIQPASAGGPPVPWDPPLDTTTSEWCGFEVRLQGDGRYVPHFWTDEAGNIHYVETAMGVQVTATNVETQKSVAVMSTGQLSYTQDPEDINWTLSYSGPWVFTADPATALEEPGLFYSAGRIYYSGNDPFVYRRSGRLIDLCEVLAP